MNRAAKLLRAISALAGLAISTAAFAASPTLSEVLPRGAQRGDEVEMTLTGNRLSDARDVFIYQPGIAVTDVKAKSNGAVTCKFKIAKDATYGEYQVRVRTATGISELRNFYVGVYPVVKETAEVGASARNQNPKNPTPPEKLPSTFKNPQKIVEQNVTVAGVLEAEQADFYAVECKKGQRLNVEVEAMRLGNILDTNITIFDTKRFEIAGNDDNAFSRQDACVSTLIPADGTYIIQLRESSYGGGPNGFYRMHVGDFPRPKAIYPGGGKAGEEVKVKCIGDAGGTFDYTVKIPKTAGETFPVYAEQNGQMAPTPNPFRVSEFGNVMESEEPNDTMDKATVYSGELPIALNGIIDHKGDVDFFKFNAKKGQVLDINVYARHLRTPLDSVLELRNSKGNVIASNDDTRGPDSYIKFNVPADDSYYVSIHDQLKNGGPEYVYRIEITEQKPSLTLAIPNMGVNYTQDRQWVVIPKGGKFATTIRATRQDVSGELKLIAKDLPPGVHMTADPIPNGSDTFAVLFEADKDAPVGGKLVELTAKSTDDKTNTEGEFKQMVELAQSGNNAPYYVTTATKLAVAVAEEAPFSIEVTQPKVPMVQSGVMDLKVKAIRKPDFKGPIVIKSVWDPTGVGSGSLTLNPDQTEGVLSINAQTNARLGKWKTILLASADVSGPTWVASNAFEFEVAAPYLTASIQRSSVLQGQSVPITVKLDQKTDFPGKAKIKLLGLPTEATTDDKEITKDDKEIVFNVKTTDKTPAATHNGLVCRVEVMKDGEPIIHSIGNGGVLRVDPIKKPGSGSPDPTKKPKPVAAK